MPLEFTCTQDIRKMKSVHGKKFCELCRKNVFDVRRKSVEKIVKLREEKKGCCLIIYEHQLEVSDQIIARRKLSNRKVPFQFKYAASLTALSFLPVSAFSQNTNQMAVEQNEIKIRDAQGKIQSEKKSTDNSADLKKTKTTFKGRLIPDENKPLKKLFISIGYCDLEGKYHEVTNCKSNLIGRFKFVLTEKQKGMFTTSFPIVKVKGFIVKYDRIDPENSKKRIDLYLTKLLPRMGFSVDRVLD